MREYSYSAALDRSAISLRELLKEIEGHLSRGIDLKFQRKIVLKQLLNVQILRFNRS